MSMEKEEEEFLSAGDPDSPRCLVPHFAKPSTAKQTNRSEDEEQEAGSRPQQRLFRQLSEPSFDSSSMVSGDGAASSHRLSDIWIQAAAPVAHLPNHVLWGKLERTSVTSRSLSSESGVRAQEAGRASSHVSSSSPRRGPALPIAGEGGESKGNLEKLRRQLDKQGLDPDNIQFRSGMSSSNSSWVGEKNEEDNRKNEEGQAQAAALGVPSVGSIGHATEECRPCLYVQSKVGCRKGAACDFCHYSHEDRPKKGKLRPCKSKRDRYHKLLHHLSREQDEHPDAFNIEEARLPPSIAASSEEKQKLLFKMMRLKEIKAAQGHETAVMPESLEGFTDADRGGLYDAAAHTR